MPDTEPQTDCANILSRCFELDSHEWVEDELLDVFERFKDNDSVYHWLGASDEKFNRTPPEKEIREAFLTSGVEAVENLFEIYMQKHLQRALIKGMIMGWKAATGEEL